MLYLLPIGQNKIVHQENSNILMRYLFRCFIVFKIRSQEDLVIKTV